MVTYCYTPHMASLDFISSQKTHAMDLRSQTHLHKMKLYLNFGKAGTVSCLAHFPSIDPQ